MPKTALDGTEQTLFESTELGEYSGWIFLDQLQSGDTVVIRVYVKDVEDGVYKKWLEDSYSGVLSCPALHLEPTIGKVGLKVTIQQTAGTYRIVTHMWFKR
jgi:hypothetical protein